MAITHLEAQQHDAPAVSTALRRLVRQPAVPGHSTMITDLASTGPQDYPVAVGRGAAEAECRHGEPPGRRADLAAAIARRTDEVVAALRSLDEPDLLAPSELPGWSRLTIACHLRYGATALAPMTDAVLADLPTSYYPGGRDRQRPGTLSPEPGETRAPSSRAWRRRSADLDARWAGLAPDDWSRPVREPDDLPDLGTLTLAQLALLRLTEVEVHGTDLGLGLADWSADFVGTALPFRVDRLDAAAAGARHPGPVLLAARRGGRSHVPGLGVR